MLFMVSNKTDSTYICDQLSGSAEPHDGKRQIQMRWPNESMTILETT